jgi:hypothetical protein
VVAVAAAAQDASGGSIGSVGSVGSVSSVGDLGDVGRRGVLCLVSPDAESHGKNLGGSRSGRSRMSDLLDKVFP